MGKKFEELDVIDDYLMTAIASDMEIGEEVSRLIVSTLLQRQVGKVHVTAQKVIPGVLSDYRGIRMDVEIEEVIQPDTSGSVSGPEMNIYDVEPHLKKDLNFPRHNRFRQAKIDSKHMKSGDNNFSKLPNLYVIMILNFDLFGRDYMMYTFRNTCVEEPDLSYEDGLKFIYFYTGGNKGGNEQIKNLLRYLEDSKIENVSDEVTKKLHRLVEKAKCAPEAREAYMTWDMYIDMMKAEEREMEKTRNQIVIIQKKIRKAKSIEQIADEMETEIPEIQMLYDLIVVHPDMSEQELLEEYQKR